MVAGLWVIPEERMKGKAAHSVPLTPDIQSLLERLPRFNAGTFFSRQRRARNR